MKRRTLLQRPRQEDKPRANLQTIKGDKRAPFERALCSLIPLHCLTLLGAREFPLQFTSCRSNPKGPFRTKNTTTTEKLVNYYAVVFLLRPPVYYAAVPSWRGKMSVIPRKMVSAEGAPR